MKTKISILDTALFLLLAFFIVNDAVLANARLDSGAGRSLEYLSASGGGVSSLDKVYFVKAIYTAFSEPYSAARRSHRLVQPVNLERVAL